VLIEGSTEGQSWHRVGRVNHLGFQTAPALVTPPADMSARYVRLTADDAQNGQAFHGDLADIAEVSVWPGRPALPIGAPTATSGPRHHTTHRGWLVAAAAVIIAVVLAGAGFLIGRRRARA
jgi:hypothetical protein